MPAQQVSHSLSALAQLLQSHAHDPAVCFLTIRTQVGSLVAWWCRHDGLGRRRGHLRGDGGAPAGRTVAVATTMTLQTCLSDPVTEDD